MRGAMQRFGKGKGAFPGDLRDLPELSAGTMPGEKKRWGSVNTSGPKMEV